MRLAVFSDVHGNPFALQAVLDAISCEGKMDGVIAAGDHCWGGSAPGACIDRLREAGVMAVYGNTEQYLLFPDRVPPDDFHRSQWDTILPVILWTYNQLNDSQKAWLASLPFSLHFSPNGDPAADLVIVHANPRNCEVMLYPAEIEQRSLWGEVRQTDNDPSLNEVMEGFPAGTLVFGHFHFPSIRLWKGITLVDVASVSLPSIDHDRHARYTILNWNGSVWEITQRAVSYIVKEEQKALEKCGIPDWIHLANVYD